MLTDADVALLDSTRTFMSRTSATLRRRAREVTDETMLVARYTTGSHTSNMVPLFAKGPGAERFGGVIDNHVIGQILLDMVGR
jgi:alkaline phosphatase